MLAAKPEFCVSCSSQTPVIAVFKQMSGQQLRRFIVERRPNRVQPRERVGRPRRGSSAS